MHAHAHAHDHHHDHGHHHHHPHPAGLTDKRYTIAIALNLTYVVFEASAGFIANSTALLADAAHNLSDVLGLALAGGATLLAKRAASDKRTYGYSKATVLAALANALVLVAACGGIFFEAVQRFFQPATLQPLLVMVMAAGGVVVNGVTALLFIADRKNDVNVRGAFLHMLGDAGVSAGVIIAGALIWWTHLSWIDPLASILIVAAILWTTWGLLCESLDLAMDAAPAHINVAAVRDYLSQQEGVTAVHDLHVWAMGATAPALTAHLVRPEGSDDAFLAKISDGIAHEFGIEHVTLQVEKEQRDNCAEC